jgi:hypothetical protein
MFIRASNSLFLWFRRIADSGYALIVFERLQAKPGVEAPQLDP